MDSDLLRELHLCQLALAAELPNLPAYKLELGWPVHARFVDFYAIEK